MTFDQAIDVLHRANPDWPRGELVDLVTTTKLDFGPSELRLWRQFRELKPPRAVPCRCGDCAVCLLKRCDA